MFSFEMTPEQRQLQELARQFAADQIIPVAAECDAAERFPEDVYRTAWETGLMNLEVPAALGGAGLRALDAVCILEELNYGCAGITNALAANGLAVVPLLVAGTGEQKRRHLGQLTAEMSFAASCATETGAGSGGAAATITCRKVGGEYVLNGVRRFVANGSVARWYVLFATPDQGGEPPGLTCFVCAADLPGITAHRLRDQLGLRAADTADVAFEEVVVPRQALVGAEGDGPRIAAQAFERARPALGAVAAGISRRAFDESTRYALERQQFGQPIGDFQAVQLMLADMAIDLEAMRLLTYRAAWMVDRGMPAALAAGCARAFSADAALRITADAVQVFGGYGYMKEYPVEKLLRDARLLQVYEGSSERQRLAIARGLMQR